jgi:alkylation response protein AidB-like acyl-CoA dehydrogenase
LCQSIRGQRQTDSGSVVFENVKVYPDEIFGQRLQSDLPFRSIRALLAQLNLANIYLGIATGAFTSAQTYTRTISKPWPSANVNQASQDPYYLLHYGELWVELQAATALIDRAASLLDQAWLAGWQLTATQRGDTAIAIATAKAAATKAGLAITNQIFELMGARSTHSQYGFDRFWRNLRTFTLHDPVDYKLREIGDWVLNQQYPQPNFYS